MTSFFEILVLLAAGCIHLLPDASDGLKDLHGAGDYPLAPLLAYSTFIILMLVHMLAEYFALNVAGKTEDRAELINSQQGDAAVASALAAQLASSSNPRRWASAIVLLAGLGFHSFLAGMSLGAQKDVHSVVDILGPILAHKTLAAAALGSSIVNAHAPNHVFYTLITLFALTTPLGSVVGLAISQFSDDMVWASAFKALAAGTFVYVAVIEIIPDALSVKNGLMKLLIQFLSLVLGFGLMAMLAVWV